MKIQGTVSLALLAAFLVASSSSHEAIAQQAESEWTVLFDGTSLDGWRQVGPGSFVLEPDGAMRTEGGMGLFYYVEESFRDFVLELDWKVNKYTANSGVFVRFPETDDPWSAVNEGYEIQIDHSRDPDHATGSVYTFSAPFNINPNPIDQWNSYRIKVTGQRYEIWLNDEKINDFVGNRSREGYIGLQNHDGNSKVRFRNIRVKPLEDVTAQTLAEHFAIMEAREEIRVLMVTATHGFRHSPAIQAQKEVLMALSETTEFRVDTTEDLTQLNPENLSKYDVLFLANATLRTDTPPQVSATEMTEGTFANYELMLKIPDNEISGKLALSGEASALTGVIVFNLFPEPAEVTNIVHTDTSLTFSWDSGAVGVIDASLAIDGNQVTGTMAAGNMEIPIEGSQTSAAGFSPMSWNVTVDSPQGSIDAVLTLTGPDAGEIVFPQGATPLQEVRLDSTSINFVFDGDQFGMISGTATTEGDTISGHLSLDAMPEPIPFAGAAVSEKDSGDVIGPHITEEQKSAVLEFLRAGKGLAVAHAGLDALYGWDEYRKIVGGGLFTSHPWTQNVRITIDDPDNPAVSHFGDSFWIHDEIYVLDENPRWDSRVLMSLDMESVTPVEDAAGAERYDYPIAWIRKQDGGRVFVTKLGHFDHVWETPAFLQHVLQGLRIAAGRLEADFSGRRVKETIADDVWPDDLAVDERGNVWIAELRGKVHHYEAATGEVRQIAHLTTTDPTNIEHGLLGIEVDPDFYHGQPYLYLYYTDPNTIINTLSRFEYRDGMLDLDSEHVLLRVPTEPTCCHQAGDIEWGTDSTLFLSTGDTGMSEVRPGWKMSEEQLEAFKAKHDLKGYHWSRLVDSERSAQNLQDLRGKILRINRDGTIPQDNPFFGEPGIRWEIYAYGLRNPYRFKVDHETGALLIGVVGPDASFDYDEYNISETGGENFGWPRTFGKLFYNEWTPEMIPGFVPPIWEYTYESGGRSATVGPIYRHDGAFAFPEFLQNKVFVFDWARRWIKYGDLVDTEFTSDSEADMRNTPPVITIPAKRLVNIKTFDRLRSTAPISMELGPDGSIYVAEFDGFWDAGPRAKVTRYRWIREDE